MPIGVFERGFRIWHWIVCIMSVQNVRRIFECQTDSVSGLPKLLGRAKQRWNLTHPTNQLLNMDEEASVLNSNPGKGPLHHRVVVGGKGDKGAESYDEEDVALLNENGSSPASIHGHASDRAATSEETPSTPPTRWERVIAILHKNLLPDQGVVVAGFPSLEGEFTVKFLKFVLLTFGSIAIVHKIVEHHFTDRDRTMTLFHIWRYDTNIIIMDCVVYFLVGRLWKQRGVDHLAWIIPMIICNVYFECQNYATWLRHNVSLFEIHCLWPWQLWVFVGVLVPTIIALVLAHVHRAWTKRVLLVKLVELSLCICFFLAPVMSSPYFHLHHWFAGWLLGMHCNFDVWWSRAIMAYCWVRSWRLYWKIMLLLGFSNVTNASF